MQTRLQRRILFTHDVLFHTDLLALILAHVSGVPNRRRIARDHVPRVCKSWNSEWKMLMSMRTPSPMYRHCVYLSHDERESRVLLLSQFEQEFRRSSEHLRYKCMKFLRCKREGVDTLLGHMVIHMAFSLRTPVNTGGVVPPVLWTYIDKVRMYIAQYITQQRPLSPSCDVYPLLPEWYTITAVDPLHVALVAYSKTSSLRNQPLETQR